MGNCLFVVLHCYTNVSDIASERAKVIPEILDKFLNKCNKKKLMTIDFFYIKFR